MSNAKFLGTTDEVTTCDCCGRKDLKSTVALELADHADPVYYGVTCAAHALKIDTKTVRAGARAADRAKEDRAAAERRAAADLDLTSWFAFLASNGKGEDNFTRIESLGGYTAARAAWRS